MSAASPSRAWFHCVHTRSPTCSEDPVIACPTTLLTAAAPARAVALHGAASRAAYSWSDPIPVPA